MHTSKYNILLLCSLNFVHVQILVFYAANLNSDIMLKQERFDNIIKFFKKNRPDVETELQYSDPYELIVAVQISV